MKKLAHTGTMATTQDQSSLAKAEPSTPADRGDENAVHPTFFNRLCATRLHNRNAAGPRCPCPKRSAHKAIPYCLCIHAALTRAWHPGDFSHEVPLSSSTHSPRPDHKGNSNVCALRVHKLGPESESGTFPRAFVCQRVPRSRHLFAVARTLPSPTMFAFCSLDVKLLFVRSDCTCGPTCSSAV